MVIFAFYRCREAELRLHRRLFMLHVMFKPKMKEPKRSFHS
jgi:hypothetical protein